MSILRFVGRAVVRGVVDEFDKAQTRKLEKKKNTICCSECKTVVDSSSSACHNCGSQQLCSEHDLAVRKYETIQREQVEAQGNMATRMQDEMISAHERQRIKDFKARKKALTSGFICSSCNFLYESSHKFCPACSSQTSRLDKETINIYLQDEFPEQYNKDG